MGHQAHSDGRSPASRRPPRYRASRNSVVELCPLDRSARLERIDAPPVLFREVVAKRQEKTSQSSARYLACV